MVARSNTVPAYPVRACHGSRAADCTARRQEPHSHNRTAAAGCCASASVSDAVATSFTVGGGKFVHYLAFRAEDKRASGWFLFPCLFVIIISSFAGEFAPGRMMRCRGGLGGEHGPRLTGTTSESRPKSRVCTMDCGGPLFFSELSEMSTFLSRWCPLVAGVEFVGEGKALEKSIHCGFVGDEKDGYEEDDVRKKRGKNGDESFLWPSNPSSSITISSDDGHLQVVCGREKTWTGKEFLIGPSAEGTKQRGKEYEHRLRQAAAAAAAANLRVIFP